MRLGLWGLAALFVGAFGAHFLLQDRGYVLISFRSYVVEMSVPALLLVLVVLYVIVRAVLRAWRAPRRLGEALSAHRAKQAGTKLTRGLIHLTEGDFTRGERLLTQSLRSADAPLVNYLMAARAAQSQGSLERRNEWLKLAYEELPEAEVAILLTQAELQLEAKEHERALATLQKVLDARDDHPVAVTLLARTYRALGDPGRVLDLIARLPTRPPEEKEQFAIEALDAAVAAGDLDAARLNALWSQWPGSLKKAPRVLRAYALALQRLGEGASAEKMLRSALKKSWQPALVDAYGQIEAVDSSKQLQQAERWLRQHPEDGTLLLAAARLCMANELWGKARSYLESSLALAPDPRTYAIYGDLLEQLGEQENAAVAYHSGLRLAGGGAGVGPPALNAPEPS